MNTANTNTTATIGEATCNAMGGGGDANEAADLSNVAMLWVGLKEGAATFLRTKGDPKQSLDAIVSEIRRQARWLRRHQPLSAEWVPSTAWRQPLLLRGFLATFPLGYRYWTEVPSATAIETCR